MQIESEIRSVWRELKVYKKQLWVIAIAGLVMAGSDVGEINLLKSIFDGIQKGNIDVIKASFTIFIALAFAKNIARYIHIFNMNMVSERVTQGYREKLQRKFMKLNLTFHNTYASGAGGLISRVMNDVQVIYHGLRMFADLFREPVAAVGFLATLFYLNWKLTLYIIVVLPLILFFLRTISKNIKKFGLKGQEDLERITGTLKESLDGVRIIQSFNLEPEMENRFHAQSGEFLNSRRQVHRLVESSGPVTEFTLVVVCFSVILYMAYDISAGRATIGDLIAYFGAIMSLQNPVKKFQESYVRIQETVVSIRRAHDLLNLNDEVPQSQHPVGFPEDWKRLEYRNVSFRYGNEYVLKNFNLTIQRGDQIAFVGASGSGKSTLVNLLERFFDPTEGQILIDDTPITEIRLNDLRHHIALVTQDVFLFSDSIERNIWAGDFSKDPKHPEAGVQNAANAANAHDFIQRTPGAYQNRVGDRGNLLSGGEKQRVSIARAVFKDAPILILDEATSALDSKSEAEVQKGLDAAMKGRTALIIAHRLSTVQKAHRICVMKAGELIEMGSHQELLAKNGEYATMYKLQS